VTGETKVFSGVGFRYSLRRSSRAKNLRITVGEDGVTLTLPHGTAERHGHDFIAERSDWINRTLAKIEASDEIIASRTLSDGSIVPYLGFDLALRLADGPSGRVTLRPETAELLVRVPDLRRETVADALERWYRRQARDVFKLKLDYCVRRNGTSYERLAIRDQKTRWGSCSTSGTISFNWRLMLAPEDVVDYVVEHEAAHIEVADHSPRFWALVDERMPGWEDQRQWLRRNGSSLRLN
jgi:predicted metal-dependent hydrolase